MTGRIPGPPEDLNTRFLLYTRDNRNYEIPISYTDVKTNLPKHFNPDLPLKFIIHGFTETGMEGWVKKMKDAFLDAVSSFTK